MKSRVTQHTTHHSTKATSHHIFKATKLLKIYKTHWRSHCRALKSQGRVTTSYGSEATEGWRVSYIHYLPWQRGDGQVRRAERFSNRTGGQEGYLSSSGRHAELGSWGSWVWYGAETGCSCVSVCVCDPQTPKEFKVEMEETREVNIETVTMVMSNI